MRGVYFDNVEKIVFNDGEITSYNIETKSGKYYTICRETYKLYKCALKYYTIESEFEREKLLTDYCKLLKINPENFCIDYYTKKYLEGKLLIKREDISTNVESKKLIFSRIWVLGNSITLEPYLKWLEFLFQKPIMVINIIVFIITIFFYFSMEFLQFNEATNKLAVIYALPIIILGTIIHELGHLVAANKMKVRNCNFGITIRFVFIALFVDVNKSWMINRNDRLIINFGGLYFQMLYVLLLIQIIIIFGVDWLYLGIYFNFQIMLLNILPFNRFDGYWILCDLVRIDNISKRYKFLMKYIKKGNINQKMKIVFVFYYIINLLFFGLIINICYFSISNLFVNIYDYITKTSELNVFQLLISILFSIIPFYFIYILGNNLLKKIWRVKKNENTSF